MSLSRGGILVKSRWAGQPGIERTKTASGRLWCRAEEPVPMGKPSQKALAVFAFMIYVWISEATSAESENDASILGSSCVGWGAQRQHQDGFGQRGQFQPEGKALSAMTTPLNLLSTREYLGKKPSHY
eukprot:1140407-Pelagomonas_calceolata.AAC.1